MHAKSFIDSNVWLYALIQQDNPDPRPAAASALLARIPRPCISCPTAASRASGWAGREQRLPATKSR